MSEIAVAYKSKTGTEIKLTGGGATKGIRAAAAGATDIGGSCRNRLYGADGSVHPEEADSKLTQVAWDALVVIAHPDNPVDNISMADLKKVYEGKITSWKDLGGPDKRIALTTRKGTASGVGHMFRMLVFNQPGMEFKARSIKFKSTGPLEKKVEKTVTAMGMDGISSAKKRTVKFLSIGGVSPSKENLSSGQYPLFRPLYLVLNKNASAESQAVIDFVLSAEGQTIISQQGTVNMQEGAALTPLWEAKKSAMGL